MLDLDQPVQPLRNPVVVSAAVPGTSISGALRATERAVGSAIAQPANDSGPSRAKGDL